MASCRSVKHPLRIETPPAGPVCLARKRKKGPDFAIWPLIFWCAMQDEAGHWELVLAMQKKK
jgi:hypothetical protein